MIEYEKKHKKLLSEHFPDGVVYDLSNTDDSLYRSIHYRSNRLNIPMSKYIYNLGFILLTKFEETDSENRQSLLKLYPNGVVYNLSGADRVLYARINSTSDRRGMTAEEYIKHLGLGYKAIDRISDKEKRYIEELLEYYPDRVIIKLSSKDNDLYMRLVHSARKQDVTISDYLTRLGFTYKTKRKATLDVNRYVPKRDTKLSTKDLARLESELLKHYPDRIVTGLYNRDSALYHNIYRLAKKKNKTTSEWLESFGFTVI